MDWQEPGMVKKVALIVAGVVAVGGAFIGIGSAAAWLRLLLVG